VATDPPHLSDSVATGSLLHRFDRENETRRLGEVQVRASEAMGVGHTTEAEWSGL